MMDLMLRFGSRMPDVEERLRRNGVQVILPRRRRDKGAPPDFFAVVSEAPGFREQRREAGAFLQKHRVELSTYSRSHAERLELNFGIESDRLASVVTDLPFGPDFLRLLADLRIQLNVTVYGTSQDYQRQLGGDQAPEPAE
jgi:hypothetical protein